MLLLQQAGEVASDAWSACRSHWRSLALAGLVTRLGSAIVLTPLYAVALRLAVAGSGRSVLTDQDLLYFVTSPIGVAGLVAVGALAVAFAALEFGLFLAVLSQPPAAASVVESLWFTALRAPRIGVVAARIVVQSLLWLAPAGLAVAIAYLTLLTKYDINYYLDERPASFWAAVSVATLVAAYIATVFVKLVSDWFLALPIALFESESAQRVCRVSRERTLRDRWAIRTGVAVWAAGSVLLSLVATMLVGAAAWTIAPYWPRSLTAVAIGVGLGFSLAAIAAAAANLVGAVALAALMQRTYWRLGGDGAATPARAMTAAQRAGWLTRTRLAAGVPVAMLAAATLGFVALASVPVEDQVLVIGHRGSPLSAPGNTLASVRAAIAEGADWVEIDVQETADGEVVVFHDSDFMKAASIDLKIWDATAERLAAIDLGSRFSPKFAGEGVPTLAQVLEECRGKAGVLVELKYYGHDQDLEQRVVDLVEAAGMADQTMFMSLHRDGVAKLKALRPDWRVGQLLSVSTGSTQKLPGEFLGINAKFADRGRIGSAHRAGRDVYVWTVDDPLAMSALISRGADGLITNVPATARAVLAERAELPPVARLLIDLADRFRIAAPFTTQPANPVLDEGA